MAQPVRIETIDHDSAMDETLDAVRVTQVGTAAEGELGQPELRHDNEGWGQWEHKALQAKYKDSYDTNRHFRYGNWAVHLNGGPQASGESWASVSVPLNDLKVSDLSSIAYDWYAHQLGTSHILDIGPNLVFSAYDPDDHSKRVDFNTYAVDNNIFMDDGLANRPIEAGWYKYEMTSTDATERVYWYGNNTGTHDTTVTQGADYYWSQYIVDNVFKNYRIYRVQVMIGYWSSTRSTGDVWIGNLRINGIPVNWEPSEADKIAIQKREENMFGRPELASNNNGRAEWVKGKQTDSTYQKSATGWLGYLYGGVQTNDDYAAISIPVNDLPVPDFKTALWSYYMSATEAFGCNMVIWVHDPFNYDNRAEITQRQQHADLDKAAGWGAHEMNPSTDYFFYYGEGTTNTNLTAGTDYGWDDFVADELFNTWRIFRISFESGWYASTNTLDPIYLADVQLNGQLIKLGPPDGRHKKTILISKTLENEGGYSAEDVMSESDTGSAGTDWDIDLGGAGYITKATAFVPVNAMAARITLFLYSFPPTCELDDNAANNGPVAGDMPYFVGAIDFPALSDLGTGGSYAIATPSTTGNLPLSFDANMLYGVAVTRDAMDPTDDVLLTFHLTADMEG